MRTLFLGICLSLALPAYAQFKAKTTKIMDLEYGLAITELDWNTDGLPDVLTGSYVGEGLYLHIQKPKGVFTSQKIAIDAEEIYSFVVGYFNESETDQVLIFHDRGVDWLYSLDEKPKRVQNHFSDKGGWIDFNGDGALDFVMINGRDEKGINLWQNSYKNGFEKIANPFPAIDYKDIAVTDFDKNRRQDVVALTDTELLVYTSTGKGSFEKKGNYAVSASKILCAEKEYVYVAEQDQLTIINTQENKKQPIKLPRTPLHFFPQDIDQDGRQDFWLFLNDDIHILFKETDGSFSLTEKVFSTKGYPKKAVQTRLASTLKTSFNFYAIGAGENYHTCTAFELPLPTISRNNLQNNPFPKAVKEGTWKAIKNELQGYYTLPTTKNILTYFYPDSGEMGVLLEKHYFLFDKAGKLIESSIPKKVDTAYTPWHKRKEIHKGKPAKYIYYCSESYSDGLEYVEWTYTFLRYTGSNNWVQDFDNEQDKKVQEKYLAYLRTIYNTQNAQHHPDIFKYDYKDSKGKHEEYYAVYVFGLLYLFDLKGELHSVEIDE